MSLSTTEIVENTISMEYRIERKDRFMQDYPDYIPVFIKYYDSDSIYRNILHRDIQFMKLIYVVRERRKISPTIALMTLIERERDIETNEISCINAPGCSTIGEIANKFMHKDGFLYLNVTTENVFG